MVRGDDRRVSALTIAATALSWRRLSPPAARGPQPCTRGPKEVGHATAHPWSVWAHVERIVPQFKGCTLFSATLLELILMASFPPIAGLCEGVATGHVVAGCAALFDRHCPRQSRANPLRCGRNVLGRQVCIPKGHARVGVAE